MASPERANILVVDDLAEKELVYRAILDELDQNMVMATSGAAALQQLMDHEFAVVLLDVNMPGMNGFETAALIRKRKKTRHTPIIFVTAYADDLQTSEAYSLGAVDFILSPIVPEVLRAKIRVFVELYRMRAELAQSHQALELRIAERTAELASTAERLRAEVAERARAEAQLTLLVRELSHRVRNMLAILQSIAQRTLTETRSVEEAREILTGRLQALGRAQALLTQSNWKGAALSDLVAAEMSAFAERAQIDGPPLMLNASAAQNFALIVHELSTNAAKYGALSSNAGEVKVSWSIDGAAKVVEFQWQEQGGPQVRMPTRDGFGMALIRAMANTLGDAPVVHFAPEGVRCQFEVPLANVMPA